MLGGMWEGRWALGTVNCPCCEFPITVYELPIPELCPNCVEAKCDGNGCKWDTDNREN